MTILIRLNKGKDDDLIYLHEHTDFSFQKNVKMILSEYLEGRNVSITLPVMKEVQVTNKQHHQIHISFNEKKDLPLVQFLTKNVPPKKRSIFLKNVLRSSLVGNILPEEFLSEDMISYQNDINQKMANVAGAVEYLPKKGKKTSVKPTSSLQEKSLKENTTSEKEDIIDKDKSFEKSDNYNKVADDKERKDYQEEPNNRESEPVKEDVPVKTEEPVKEEPLDDDDGNLKEEPDDGVDMFDVFSKMIDDSYTMAAKK